MFDVHDLSDIIRSGNVELFIATIMTNRDAVHNLDLRGIVSVITVYPCLVDYFLYLDATSLGRVANESRAVMDVIIRRFGILGVMHADTKWYRLTDKSHPRIPDKWVADSQYWARSMLYGALHFGRVYDLATEEEIDAFLSTYDGYGNVYGDDDVDDDDHAPQIITEKKKPSFIAVENMMTMRNTRNVCRLFSNPDIISYIGSGRMSDEVYEFLCNHGTYPGGQTHPAQYLTAKSYRHRLKSEGDDKINGRRNHGIDEEHAIALVDEAIHRGIGCSSYTQQSRMYFEAMQLIEGKCPCGRKDDRHTIAAIGVPGGHHHRPITDTLFGASEAMCSSCGLSVSLGTTADAGNHPFSEWKAPIIITEAEKMNAASIIPGNTKYNDFIYIVFSRSPSSLNEEALPGWIATIPRRTSEIPCGNCVINASYEAVIDMLLDESYERGDIVPCPSIVNTCNLFTYRRLRYISRRYLPWIHFPCSRGIEWMLRDYHYILPPVRVNAFVDVYVTAK